MNFSLPGHPSKNLSRTDRPPPLVICHVLLKNLLKIYKICFLFPKMPPCLPHTFSTPNPYNPLFPQTLPFPPISLLLFLSLSRSSYLSSLSLPLPPSLSPDPMASSSSSTTSRTRILSYFSNVECKCKVRAALKTAHTEINVGRRFVGCGNYKSETERGCNFFEWVDPPTCPRGLEFGNEIVKKKNDLEKKVEELKKKEDWYELHISLMSRNMREMETDFNLKMSEWRNKEEWRSLEMDEIELLNDGLAHNMRGFQVQIDGLKRNIEVLEARNERLMKMNKGMKVLIGIMVVSLAMIVMQVFGGEGSIKNKLLALN